MRRFSDVERLCNSLADSFFDLLAMLSRVLALHFAVTIVPVRPCALGKTIFVFSEVGFHFFALVASDPMNFDNVHDIDGAIFGFVKLVEVV